MILHVIRALFILVMAAAGWTFLLKGADFLGQNTWLVMSITLTIGVIFVCLDIISPRRKIIIFSGTFLGLLVGLLLAWVLSFVMQLVVDQIPSISVRAGDYLSQRASPDPRATLTNRDVLLQFVNLVDGIVCCYLATSFILQTKDDFRFVIPYVEFSKQTRGARPIIVDTSVIVDGRILDIAETGIMESRLIVPRFVLTELQAISDSADRLKRNRGRRGLDILSKLQANKRLDVIVYDSSLYDQPGLEGVDQKLLALAKDLNARILTTDFNLSKVAQVRGVDVVSINDLANALKPVVMPGERMKVRLIKPGEEASQGVGYMEDGTMVVVEQGRPHINEEVEFTVTSVLQTSAGRMVFGRYGDTAISNGRHRHAETPA